MDVPSERRRDDFQNGPKTPGIRLHDCTPARSQTWERRRTVPPRRPEGELGRRRACRTIQTSAFEVDPVMELEDWFYDSRQSIVQCVTADFRLIPIHPNDPVHDPSLETLIQGLKRQPMPGDTPAVRDMELPRWRFYMIMKKFSWEKTSYRTLRECLFQLLRLMEENQVYEVGMQRIGSQLPDFLNWWQTRGLISEVFTGSPMLVWVHYGGPRLTIPRNSAAPVMRCLHPL